MQIAHKFTHFMKRESLGVKSEGSPPIHVIDICPHGFQGNICLAVILNDLSKVEDILVAVSAIVELVLSVAKLHA